MSKTELQKSITKWAWDCRLLLAATILLTLWVAYDGMSAEAWIDFCLVSVGWVFEIVGLILDARKKKA